MKYIWKYITTLLFSAMTLINYFYAVSVVNDSNQYIAGKAAETLRWIPITILLIICVFLLETFFDKG